MIAISAEVPTIRSAVHSWTDAFINNLSKEGSLDHDKDTEEFFQLFLVKEAKLQAQINAGKPSNVKKPELMVLMTNMMNYLELPHTEAAAILAGLGVSSPREAHMMVAILKRLYELQSPKPEKLTAAHVSLLLKNATISQALFDEMWEAQKGHVVGIDCENLVNITVARDFEN